MKKYFIAPSVIGSEYIYRKTSMVTVSERHAEEAVKCLNMLVRKPLRDNEVWALHENDAIMDEIITMTIVKRKNGRFLLKSK